jgi:uncharacterized protein YerC
MRKLLIDKETDVKCLLDQGKPYTEITRECGVSHNILDQCSK